VVIVPQRPVVYPARPYYPPHPVYVAPAPTYVAPGTTTYVAPRPAYVPTSPAAGGTVPATAAPGVGCAPSAGVDAEVDQFIFVLFQPNASATNTAIFLKSYDLKVADGPNADGFFKLRLSTSLTPDQFSQMIDSMKAQTSVVSQVSSQ
jgi:hypothetical protein